MPVKLGRHGSAVSVFLNRVCPRKCPYCNVVDKEKESRRLGVDDWKRGFDILLDQGFEFFLILGTEPLCMGNELVELVEFWSDRKMEYGLYTTSPFPLFGRYAERLIEVGLRNWSSGIDFIPEVYAKVKSRLSTKTVRLVEQESEILVSKAIDGLKGMKYMFSRGLEEQHCLITVSRMNIEFVPEMIEWLLDEFPSPSLRVAANYVEYGGGDFDFAFERKECAEYLVAEEDKVVWDAFIDKIRGISEERRLRIQTPLEYLYDWDYMINLDRKGNSLYCAIGVDCDGSLRKCGYRIGYEMLRYSVFDLPDRSEEIYSIWNKEIETCLGCYWVFPWMLEKVGREIVDYRSEYWRKRKLRFEKIVGGGYVRNYGLLGT